MMQTVYVETSVVSYLTSRPSKDLIVAAHQQITHEWWATCRDRYELFTSQLVHQEAAAGNPEIAALRLQQLEGITSLDLTDTATDLARALLAAGTPPANAPEDALHIAICVANGLEFLLTWNCRHIANATMRRTIEGVCRAHGFVPTILCTPEELLNV